MWHWKWAVWALLPLLAFLGYRSAAAGSVDQVTTDIIVMIASGAALTLSTNVINFPSADPDTTPSIPASQNPVQVQCVITGAFLSNVTLTVQASGNLVAGGNSIPINQVSWTATGSGFQPGTMSIAPVQAGNWFIFLGSRTFSGTFSYFLQNSWTYATGNYAATAIYTLTAP